MPWKGTPSAWRLPFCVASAERPKASVVLHSLWLLSSPPSPLISVWPVLSGLSSGGGEWDTGFWPSHARPRGSPACCIPVSLFLFHPRRMGVLPAAPHWVSACWMCYSHVCQGRPCLLGSLYCLLHLGGFRKGEPRVPVVLLATGNREPLHSHCVSVSWKDQSLCVGDTACLVTLRLEPSCQFHSAVAHMKGRGLAFCIGTSAAAAVVRPRRNDRWGFWSLVTASFQLCGEVLRPVTQTLRRGREGSSG